MITADQILIRFVGDMRQLNRSLDKTNNNLEKTTALASGVGMALTASFAVSAVAIGLGVKKAVEFETSMAKVNTMLTLNKVQLAVLSAEVEDLAKQYGKSADEIASSLFDISSAGFKGAEGMDVLNSSLELSQAGFADVKVTNEAVVRSLKAFNLNANQSSKVSKTLFGAMKTGILTMDQLATAWPKVAAGAAAAGVTMEEAAAAFSKVSDVFQAQQAATLVDRFFNKIATGTSKVQFLRDALSTGGLLGAIDALKKATGGDILALKNLGFADNDMKAAIQLMSGLAERIDAVKLAQEDLATASKIAADTTGVQFAKTMESLNTELKELGRKVLPALTNALKAANTTTGQTALATIAGVVAFGAFAKTITFIIVKVKSMIVAFTAMRTAMATMSFLGGMGGLAEMGFSGAQVALFKLTTGVVAAGAVIKTFFINLGIFLTSTATLMEAVVGLAGFITGVRLGDLLAGTNHFDKAMDKIGDKLLSNLFNINNEISLITKSVRDLSAAQKEFESTGSNADRLKVLEAQFDKAKAIRRALIEEKRAAGELNAAYIKSLKHLSEQLTTKRTEIDALKLVIKLEKERAAVIAASAARQASNIVDLNKLWNKSTKQFNKLLTIQADAGKSPRQQFRDKGLKNLLAQRELWANTLNKVEAIGNKQKFWTDELNEAMMIGQKHLRILDAQITSQDTFLMNQFDLRLKLISLEEKEKAIAEDISKLNAFESFTDTPINAQIKALMRMRNQLMMNATSAKQGQQIMEAYARRLSAIQNLRSVEGVAAAEFGTQQAVSMRLSAKRERESASQNKVLNTSIANKVANESSFREMQRLNNTMTSIKSNISTTKLAILQP